MDKYTVLVNSCDAYEDAWDPFFRLLKMQWPSLSAPIVLNTESKKYACNEFSIRVLNIAEGKRTDMQWGERFIDVLERIGTDYVLCLMEDFFLEDKVDEQVIKDCVGYMESDPEIAVFYFTPVVECLIGEYNEKLEKEKYKGFALRDKKVGYKLAAVPAMWRKEKLISFIRPFESPWIWEAYGSRRAWRSNDKFYCRKKEAPLVFVYDDLRGGAIHRGKWNGCTIKRIEERCGLEIDLGSREVEEDWLTNPEYVHPKRSIIRGIRNRMRLIRSILS